MVGHFRHASETTFQWRFPGGPMMAYFWWNFDPLSIHQLKKNNRCQCWNPSGKTFGPAHVAHVSNSKYR